MTEAAKTMQRPQRFHCDRAREASFGPGLRDYFVYRDLGFAEATSGLVQAHVLRAARSCPPGGTGRHAHDVQFQMNFLLKGWMRFEFEGHGEVTFQAGDSWIQPPGIKHELLAFSDDVENIEIVIPADFDTVDA